MTTETIIPQITGVSVRVMRSYDYNHFEVCLTASNANSLQEADELRKAATRLADKAVFQYQIARANAARMEQDARKLRYLQSDQKQILGKPEEERTPREKAVIKALGDRDYLRSRRAYNYEDEWDEPDWKDPDDMDDDDDGCPL